MIRKVMLLVGLLAIAAAPVVAATIVVSKNDEEVPVQPGPGNVPSHLVADFEWSTAGTMDFPPDMAGSATGWAEWFITAVQNTTGQDLVLEEFGFPCDGPTTGQYGWIVWIDAAVPPAVPGPASSAHHFGQFTPASNTGTTPPTTYTYVNVAAQNIVVPNGSWLWFGYDNTGFGGMTAYTGVDTWGWYTGIWDPDQPYGRTAVMQVKANYNGTVPTEDSTWSAIKAQFR